MSAINVVTLPGYYALYALYADYLLNNERHAALEDLERVRESVRLLGPALGLEQPFRKSWALRLFTGREALSAYPAELVDEAWRQLREAVAALGPPPGWRGPGRRERLSRRVFKPRPESPPAPPARYPEYPQSPVDYRRAV
jgi:hypothetical protein